MKTKRLSDKNLGIIYIILAALGFALMNLFVQLAGDVPTLQKGFFRNIVALFIVLPAAVISRKPSDPESSGDEHSQADNEKYRCTTHIIKNKSHTNIKYRIIFPHIGKGNLKYLIGRAFFGTLGLVTNFYAISHLDSISDASMLNKLSPFFALIFSIFILKEIPGRFDWISLIIAFTGALFIIKPDFGMSSFPAIVGASSGLFAGLAYTFVRKLGLRGEKSTTIIVFFSAASCLALLPFIIFSYYPMSTLQLIYLIGAGASAAMGQIFITNAYKKCPAKEISVFDYTQVIFAAILGFVFLGQMADVYSFIGYFIIISVAVFRWYRSNHM